MRPLPFAGAACAALALCALPASAQVLVEPGFEVTQQLSDPSGGAYATLASGDLFTFDGQEFAIRTETGQLVQSLGTLPAPVFTGGLAVDRTESFAIVGESSNGDLFRVDLGGGYTTIGNAVFNFDVAFDIDPNYVFVSAATSGFGMGNDILRVHVTTGVASHVAHVAGSSGPLAVEASGDLLYGTSSDAWPPPFGSSDLLRFARVDVLGGAVLSEADAAVLTPGLNGASSLALDPVFGHVFLCENNFQASANRILQIHPGSGEVIDVVAEAPTWITNLEVFTGPGDGHFRAYQPANARLVVSDTDFGLGTSDRVTLEPARPVASLAGPPVGPAAMTLTITGAEPNAAVLVYFGLQTNMLRTTYDFPVFDFRWHTALPLGDFRRLPLMTPTDANGTATFQYFDPGTMHGLYAFQAMVLEPNAKVVGSCQHVLN